MTVASPTRIAECDHCGERLETALRLDEDPKRAIDRTCPSCGETLVIEPGGSPFATGAADDDRKLTRPLPPHLRRRR